MAWQSTPTLSSRELHLSAETHSGWRTGLGTQPLFDASTTVKYDGSTGKAKGFEA